MNLNTLKRKTPNQRSIKVGRGGKRGKTAGRGTKGQNARAGRKKRPEMRDIIKKFPKLRGRGVNSLKSFVVKPAVVKSISINQAFSSGDTVSPKTLLEKGLVSKVSGVIPMVKILGPAEFTKKLSFSLCKMSVSVRESIIKAGGTVE